MDDVIQKRLRALPAVGEILTGLDAAPRWILRDAAREVLAEARRKILSGEQKEISPGEILRRVSARAQVLSQPRLNALINATGVILHTNLGRAPLGRRALERIEDACLGYSNLEYDLARGTRGSRHDLLEPLLQRLTGAESALVVNNNAAAILLALSALAAGGEVILSRGELIEIGDGFRIPDILAKSGSTLVEVGTTNRTHLDDYRRAITERTACFLKVHPSNFRVVGFTGSVERRDLVKLGHSNGLPVLEDLGSGALHDLSEYGLSDEPSVKTCLEAGVDLVMMSGDKLLGGPQAGILLGSRKWIEKCKRHPFARALRIDKLSLAALEGTLMAYVENTKAPDVPVLSMIRTSEKVLEERAESLGRKLSIAVRDALDLKIVETKARVGGGAYPAAEIPSRALSLGPQHPGALERFLRGRWPPIIPRLFEGRVLLDLRTVDEEELTTIAEALTAYVDKARERGPGLEL